MLSTERLRGGREQEDNAIQGEKNGSEDIQAIRICITFSPQVEYKHIEIFVLLYE